MMKMKKLITATLKRPVYRLKKILQLLVRRDPQVESCNVDPMSRMQRFTFLILDTYSS